MLFLILLQSKVRTFQLCASGHIARAKNNKSTIIEYPYGKQT